MCNLTLPVIAALVFVLSFSIHDVAAFNVTLDGTSAACINTPLSGSWDSAFKTCSANDLTISSGDSLTINSGMTLKISGILTNSGTITNSGAISSTVVR